MYIKIFSAALVLIFTCYAVTAGAGTDYLANELECVKLAGNFLNLIIKNEIEKAFQTIKPYFYIPESELEDLTSQTVDQR